MIITFIFEKGENNHEKKRLFWFISGFRINFDYRWMVVGMVIN